MKQAKFVSDRRWSGCVPSVVQFAHLTDCKLAWVRKHEIFIKPKPLKLFGDVYCQFYCWAFQFYAIHFDACIKFATIDNLPAQMTIFSYPYSSALFGSVILQNFPPGAWTANNFKSDGSQFKANLHMISGLQQ